MPKAYQFTSEGYFAEEIEDYGLLPNNATSTAPTLVDGHIPHWNGAAWEQVENHKDKQGYVNGEPFTVKEYGALPEGWSDTPPPPTLEEVKASKILEISSAYDTVLAYIVSPSGSSSVAAALAVADFAAEDPEGLAFIRTQLKTRRAELEAAVAAAPDAAAVQAIVVSFNV